MPYLSGERSPHNNPFARGVFFGLTHDTQRADMIKAILEGIAFNFKEGQDAFDTAGVEINRVYVVGGGSKSAYWGQILAAILNKPLIYCENSEVGAALGAARLAYLADMGADPKTAFPDNLIREIIEPNPSLVTHYQKIYPYYKKLYQNNLELFNQLYNPEVTQNG